MDWNFILPGALMIGASGMLIQMVVLSALIVLSQAPSPPAREIAVYRAVLDAKVRPEVDRWSASAGVTAPVVVLAFNRTVALCHTPADHPKPVGCLDDERVVQALEHRTPRMATVLFDGLLTTESREALAADFRMRNAANHPFPAAHLPRVITTAADDADETQKREARRTTGIATFSVPAFSEDGYALVYASYVCGGLCGQGWLFLLREHGPSWAVVKIHTLWVS